MELGPRIVVLRLRGLDVIKEAPMLVVGDDEKRALPRRAAGECVENPEHKLLSSAHVGGWVVVVRPDGAADVGAALGAAVVGAAVVGAAVVGAAVGAAVVGAAVVGAAVVGAAVVGAAVVGAAVELLE